MVGTAADAVTPGTVANPGDTSTVTFKASNGSGFAQRISNIHLTSVVACSAPLDANNACAAADVIPTGNTDSTCDTSAFTIADVPVGAADGDLAANASGVDLTEQGTLVMTDNGLDQNGCENANLAFTFSTT